MLKAVTFDLWNTVIREKSEDSIEEVVITRLADIWLDMGKLAQGGHNGGNYALPG